MCGLPAGRRRRSRPAGQSVGAGAAAKTLKPTPLSPRPPAPAGQGLRRRYGRQSPPLDCWTCASAARAARRRHRCGPAATVRNDSVTTRPRSRFDSGQAYRQPGERERGGGCIRVHDAPWVAARRVAASCAHARVGGARELRSCVLRSRERASCFSGDESGLGRQGAVAGGRGV